MGKTIVVVHTTPMTITGLRPLFEELLPEFSVQNILDDGILGDVEAGGGITETVRTRFFGMIANARAALPDVVLCACSTVGGLAEQAGGQENFPVFRIDEPMARKAVALGRKIGILATFGGTIGPTSDLVRRVADRYDLELETVLVDGAGKLLSSGKEREYDELIVSRARSLASRNDAVILAQASMARVARLLEPESSSRIFTSPRSGVERIAGYFRENRAGSGRDRR